MESVNDANTEKILFEYFIKIREFEKPYRLIKLEDYNKIKDIIITKNKETPSELIKEEDILLKIIKKNCKK